MVVEAYFEGYWMALEGGARNANPHTETYRRRSWDQGWQDAQDEGRVSER